MPNPEFWEVAKTLVAEFGATSYLPEPFQGIWIHQGQTYSDQNVRLFVDVEDTPENAAFFREFKAKLKQRFRQLDIWLVSYEIRIDKTSRNGILFE